LIIILVYF